MKSQNFILIAAIVSLLACGNDKNDKKQTSFSERIEGFWSSCLNLGDNSLLLEWTHMNGVYETFFAQYPGENCVRTDDIEEPDPTTGTYELGEKITRPEVDEAYEITYINSDPTEGPCYMIIGITGDIMYLGSINETYDCSTPETRTIEFSFDFPFTRVDL